MAQSIGVKNTDGLLKPGEDTILDDNNLVDNNPKQEGEITEENLKYLEQLAATANEEINQPEEDETAMEHRMATQSAGPIMGKTLHDINYEDYADYIDRPFSFISDDADDLRAYNQSTGEKWAHGIPKFVGKVGTNVAGSTVGLVYGGMSYLSDLVTPGENAMKGFWDNDFQRGLDNINEWMDDKLPNYYTKEEQDYNFWQSMGTANFWANDVTNGLSFVTGAVISEYLTAGMASGKVAMQAKQLLKQSAKHAAPETSAKVAKQLLKNKVVKPMQVRNAARTLRQLGTGAMYEAGVEARHHYDASLENLVEAYKKDNGGKSPGKNEMAGLVDIATKTANAVFAGNAALVGYSNYMMFPKIFGKGLNSSRNSFLNTIKSDVTSKGRAYRELFKDIGKKEVLARNAWRVLKTPLYEGFVEEGGQKLLDLAGQSSALNFYQSKRDGNMLDMVGGMVDHMDDRFADVYGSKEGQKEIGIGFILGALGIPTRSNTGQKDKEGNDIKKWQMNGAWANVREGRAYKKGIENLKTMLESNPSAVETFEKNFNTLVRAGVIQDSKDFAAAVNSEFLYENAKSDEMFNFINSRLEAGLESEIYEDIEAIRNMDNAEFRERFLYNDKNDLTDSQLEARRTSIADALLERTSAIKESKQMIDQAFVNFGPDQKSAVVHAMAVAENSDAREDAMIASIEKITGRTLEHTEYEDKDALGIEEGKASKERNKNVTERLPSKLRYREENSQEGRQVKRKLGIKSFTDPTHLEELYGVLLQKKKDLQAKLENVNKDESLSNVEKDKQQEELGRELDSILDRIQTLSQGIGEALDPDLSAMEQEYIDAWKKDDPSGFAKHGKEVIQKLKDMRKIRARRHRALAMYNDLLDLKEDLIWKPTFKNPLNFEGGENIVPPEMMLQRVINYNNTEKDIELNDKDLERLYRRHKGTVVEFEYTNANGETKTHRVIVKDTKVTSGEDKVLIQVPSMKLITLTRKKEEAESAQKEAEENNDTAGALTAKHQVDALNKQIEQEGDLKPKNLSFLLQAKGSIRTITGETIIQEYLQGALDFVGNDVSNSLSQVKEMLEGLQDASTSAKNELQAFLDQNVRSEKNQEQARLIHAQKIKELQTKVIAAKKGITAHNKTVQRLEKELEILHGISDKADTAKTEDQIQELLTGIFEQQWGGTRSDILNKLFSELDNTLLKNLISSEDTRLTLAQFAETKENEDLFDDPNKGDKLRQRWRDYKQDHKNQAIENRMAKIGDILNSTSEQARKMLAAVEPQAEQFLTRLEEIDQSIQMLSKLYEVTEDGWGISNKDRKGNKQAKQEYIELQTERSNLNNQLNAMEAALKNSAAALALTMQQNEKLTNDIVDHYIYIKDKIDELTSPTTKSTPEEPEFDTHNAYLSLNDIAKQADGLGMYLNSSPITILQQKKTTGAHKYALDRFKELNQIMDEGGKVNPIEYAHIQSQLRLFKFLPKLWKGTKDNSNFKYKMTNYRFMLANKNTIPSDLQDKITSYDPSTKEFKYASDMKGNIKTEEEETIKLILTDAKGKPVLVDGQPIYSDLPSSSLTKVVKDENNKDVEIYRYGERDLIPETKKVVLLKNGKKGVIGELTPEAEAVRKSHIRFRNDALQLTEAKLIEIKGTSFTLLYRPDGQYVAPVRASRSLVDNKNEVKDLMVSVSLNGKVTISGRDFNVPKGFTYTQKGGKLIPVRMNKLTGAAQNNVMNILRLMATNHAKYLDKEITYEQSTRISESSNKTIQQVLMDMIYIGSHSAENSPEHRKFNIKGNKIMFGEDTIEFHQLLNVEDNKEINKKFSNFISTLHHQANHYTLTKDAKVRADLYKEYKKNVKAWEEAKKDAKKRNKKFTTKKPGYPSPVYTPFIEYKVGNNMEVTESKWSNYTEYLFGDGTGTARALDQMPAYTNLVETSNELDAPQFLNSFVTLDTKKSVEQLEDIIEASTKKTKKDIKEQEGITEEEGRGNDVSNLKKKKDATPPVLVPNTLVPPTNKPDVNEPNTPVDPRLQGPPPGTVFIDVTDAMPGIPGADKLEEDWTFEREDAISNIEFVPHSEQKERFENYERYVSQQDKDLSKEDIDKKYGMWVSKMRKELGGPEVGLFERPGTSMQDMGSYFSSEEAITDYITKFYDQKEKSKPEQQTSGGKRVRKRKRKGGGESSVSKTTNDKKNCK